MTENNLYKTLLASLYAVGEENGAFLGALCTPISQAVEGTSGVLVEFPSAQKEESSS